MRTKIGLVIVMYGLALSACGKRPASYWIQQLKEEKGNTEATKELIAVGEPAVSPLIGILTYDEPRRNGVVWSMGASFYASLALQKIGAPAVPGLVAALKTGDAKLQIKVAETLGAIGDQAKEAVPALVATLRGGQGKLRVASAEALARIGKPAVPALEAARKDPEEPVRAWAAYALIESGLSLDEKLSAGFYGETQVRPDIPAEARTAAPDLAAAMQAGVEDDQLLLLVALARLGADAAPAVPALVDKLRNPAWRIRYDAAVALGNIGPGAEAAVPSLIEAATTAGSGEEAYVRSVAVRALGMMGGAAKTALAPLKDVWLAERGPLRVWAGYALVQIGRAGGEIQSGDHAVFSSLVDGLKDADPEFRKAAAQALGEIGPAAREALPALREARKDADKNVRGFVGVALKRIQPR